MRDWVLSHPATVQGLAGELAPLATAAGLAEKTGRAMHPLPSTFLDIIIDFGALTPDS